MSLRKKAIGGLAWQVSNIGIKAILNIVYLMLMSRMISKEAFGTFAIVSVILLFVTFFSEVGIGSALVQREKYNEFHISLAFYITLFLSIILFGVLYLLSPTISEFYDKRVSIDILQFIGINLLITSFGVVSNALLIRELEFKKVFISSIVSFVIGNLIVGVYLAYTGWEVWALVIAFTVKNFIEVIIKYGMVPHSMKVKYQLKAAKEIMRYGSGLTLSRTFHFVANHSDKLIVGKIAAMTSLGIYERAQKLIRMPNNYFGIVLNGILFSSFSRVQNETEKIKFNFFRVLSILSLVMFFISTYFILFANNVVNLVFGPNWGDAVPVFRAMSYLIFITIFSRFSDTLIRAKDALYWSSLIKFIYSIILVASIFIGFKWAGLLGAVYLSVIAGFISAFMMMHLSLKLIESNWSEFLKEMFPPMKFGILLLIKTMALIYLFGDGFLVMSGAIILDVIITIALLRYSPFFFGKNNIRYLANILNDLPFNFKGKQYLVSHVEKFRDN